MTPADFEELLTNLYARNDRIAEWFEKQPEKTRDIWWHMIKDAAVVDASRALYQMHVAGELSEIHAIPAKLRARCESLKVNRLLAEAEAAPSTGRCEDCDGEGLVYVWSNDWLRMKSGRTIPKPGDDIPKKNQEGVACHCHRGNTYAAWVTGSSVYHRPRYSPAQFCKVTVDPDEWIETRTPPNRVAAFDAFNQGE